MLVRISLLALLRRFFTLKTAFKTTYIILAFFPVLGLIILGASGMPMYGFDNTNLAHQIGYFVLCFSPFSIPFLLGFPIVLICDLIRRPWRSEV